METGRVDFKNSCQILFIAEAIKRSMCLTVKLLFNVGKIVPIVSGMFRPKVAWNTSHPRSQRTFFNFTRGCIQGNHWNKRAITQEELKKFKQEKVEKLKYKTSLIYLRDMIPMMKSRKQIKNCRRKWLRSARMKRDCLQIN